MKDEELQWWKKILKCDNSECGKTGFRPPLSDEPCFWCKTGTLVDTGRITL
jgi:hypothetical protein